MSSVTDENTMIRVIFQRLETVRSSLLNDVELLDYFSRHCEEFIDRLLFQCRPIYYTPIRVYSWLRCYQAFYSHLELIHKCQNDSICHILLRLDDAHLYDGNRSCMPVYMPLVDTESKILSLLDKIIASCVIHNQDITQASLQEDAETIQPVTHRSSSADQIVAGRQALEAAFNSYIEIESTTTPAFYSSPYDMTTTSSNSPSAVHYQNITQCPSRDAWSAWINGTRRLNPYIELTATPAFNRFRVGGFHQGAISPYDMIATSGNSHFAVPNQDITQCPYRDARTFRRRFSESPTYPTVADMEAFTAGRSFKYVEWSITSNTRFNLVPDWFEHHFARGFNEEAYSLNQINATSSNPRYFHSSAVHNHQNITQRHLGWDAGTIQLVTRISNDSLTDPIVASSADFNSDIESVTTPLNSETIEANNATGSHNQNVTQGSLNSARVEEEPLFNHPGFLETFLAITSQAGLTMVTIQTSGGSTSFSQNQKILFCSSAAFNVISFLSFLFVILERGRRPGIARILRGTGFLCTAYAFISIMAMLLLNDNEMLWVTGLAGIALFPVFASAFMK